MKGKTAKRVLATLMCAVMVCVPLIGLSTKAFAAKSIPDDAVIHNGNRYKVYYERKTWTENIVNHSEDT